MYKLSDKAILFLPPSTVEATALRQIENTASIKDIDEVIQNAKSLIEVKHTLRQFINIKGD